MTRAEAIRYVLAVLRSPLGLMSIPTREEVCNLAREHAITALDLIDTAHKRSREA